MEEIKHIEDKVDRLLIDNVIKNFPTGNTNANYSKPETIEKRKPKHRIVITKGTLYGLLALIVTSLIVSAAVVTYLSNPIQQTASVSTALTLQQSNDGGVTWTSQPLTFGNLYGGQSFNFLARVTNAATTSIPCIIESTITCPGGLTLEDFQSIDITYSGSTINVLNLFVEEDEWTIVLNYPITIPSGIIQLTVNVVFAQGAVGDYTITTQILPS